MPFIKSKDIVEIITVLDIAQETTNEEPTQKLINRALIILKTNNG